MREAETVECLEKAVRETLVVTLVRLICPRPGQWSGFAWHWQVWQYWFTPQICWLLLWLGHTGHHFGCPTCQYGQLWKKGNGVNWVTLADIEKVRHISANRSRRRNTRVLLHHRLFTVYNICFPDIVQNRQKGHVFACFFGKEKS